MGVAVDLEPLHGLISTGALARDRVLPVARPLESLFPDGGLLRGRVVSCRGAAATTIACSSIAAAMAGGAWAAVVDLPTFGADAAAELGVPLERLVRIDTSAVSRVSRSPSAALADWVDVMGAAIDGFDLVVATVPSVHGERQVARGDTAWQPAAVRKLAARIRQRGAVVVTVGDAGVLAVDQVLHAVRTVWDGLGDGHGHLCHRSVEIEASGRRLPGARRATIEFVAPTTGRLVSMSSVSPVPLADASVVAAVDVPAAGDAMNEREPQVDPPAAVLAEMRSADRSVTPVDLAAG